MQSGPPRPRRASLSVWPRRRRRRRSRGAIFFLPDEPSCGRQLGLFIPQREVASSRSSHRQGAAVLSAPVCMSRAVNKAEPGHFFSACFPHCSNRCRSWYAPLRSGVTVYFLNCRLSPHAIAALSASSTGITVLCLWARCLPALFCLVLPSLCSWKLVSPSFCSCLVLAEACVALLVLGEACVALLVLAEACVCVALLAEACVALLVPAEACAALRGSVCRPPCARGSVCCPSCARSVCRPPCARGSVCCPRCWRRAGARRCRAIVLGVRCPGPSCLRSAPWRESG